MLQGEVMGQDLRYAIRQLKKNPGFAAIVVLTLAVGIGAVTTVFTWANAVLFNPWPQVRARQPDSQPRRQRSGRSRLLRCTTTNFFTFASIITASQN